MRRIPQFPLLIFLLALQGLAFPSLCRAQGAPADDAPDLGEAAPAVVALRASHPKTLVFVFDVSGSMNDQGNLRRARAATVTLLREAVMPGDHVALFTFGAGYHKIFDTVVRERADLPELIQQVPTHTETGAGTNIRKPHHEALKIVNADLPNPGGIVLLTDSFNDEPKPADSTYPSYLRYYTPGGQLTKYPATAENRDYERLLRKLVASGKLSQFGIGIKIASDGRPIERLPQTAPPPRATSDSSVPLSETPITSAPAPSPVPYVIGGALLLALLAGVFALRPLFQASALRIAGGPGAAKDFQIRNGQSVRLGGTSSNVAFDSYPLPTKDPVVLIRGVRGQLFIAPAPPHGNQTTSSRVYHNGVVLEREEPVRYGDEVRISVPGEPVFPDGSVVTYKEFRLKLEDPRKTY